MTRQQAQQSVDEAFSDGIKRLFGVLVQNFMSTEGHADALKRFESGLGVHDEAHARASEAVERIFPE